MSPCSGSVFPAEHDGLTDSPPAGCTPVVIQTVLEGVDLSSLLNIVWQRVLVMDYPLTKELPPFLILEVSGSDMHDVSMLAGVPITLGIGAGLSCRIGGLVRVSGGVDERANLAEISLIFVE